MVRMSSLPLLRLVLIAGFGQPQIHPLNTVTAQGVAKDSESNLTHDHTHTEGCLDCVPFECWDCILLICEVEVPQHGDGCDLVRDKLTRVGERRAVPNPILKFKYPSPNSPAPATHRNLKKPNGVVVSNMANVTFGTLSNKVFVQFCCSLAIEYFGGCLVSLPTTLVVLEQKIYTISNIQYLSAYTPYPAFSAEKSRSQDRADPRTVQGPFTESRDIPGTFSPAITN